MPPRTRFSNRLAALHAEAPERRRQAERHVRAYYRAHRMLPKGAVTSIIPPRRLYRLVFLGELEHLLRLARVILWCAGARCCAARLFARLRR
jgi:hypothetical protein